MPKKRTALDVHIDSLHVGHKSGLYYNGEAFDHKPSKGQRWLWECWNLFWDEVEALRKRFKPDFNHVSILGEAGDVDFRNRSSEFWTKNHRTVMENATAILDPVLQKADAVHFFRGTEAHVGHEGTIDELVASNYDHAIRTEGGRPAHAWTTYELAGVLFDVAHHGKNRSKWAEENMITSLRNEIVLERTRHNEPVPDIISRGHTHWGGETTPFRKPMAVQIPAFQLPYEFIYRIDPVVRTPIVGGAAFYCEDGKVQYFPIRFTYERSKPWTPK